VNSLILLLFWWVEYGKKHPNDIPQTWIALKRVMRARFVSSYYARDLINKLQQLKQGARSVEEYYQELQIGMLHCNLEEREDAAMARFFAGLNREIQDILEYKDYANITRLFHFSCKAEREVQGCHASAKINFFAGRTNSWQRNNGRTAPPSPSPSQVAPNVQQQQQASRSCHKFSTLGALSNKEYPHHPQSLLHLQAERETSNVTAAKGLDMLCMITPPSVFWS
jgi:hypothetical protein